jgi:hypothetical protein
MYRYLTWVPDCGAPVRIVTLPLIFGFCEKAYSDKSNYYYYYYYYRLCGLVVRVLDYRSRGPGFDSRELQKKVVGLERGPLSLVSTTEEILDRKVAVPVYKIENTAIGIRHADHVAPSIRKSWQSLRRQAAVARSV